MFKIIQVRAVSEGTKLSDEALLTLCEIGQSKSLRYAIQLLTPSKILSQIYSHELVEVIIFI